MNNKNILLSFDIEEFDVPRENGVPYNTLVEGMDVSIYGTNKILDLLKEHNIRATFFCTGNFAKNATKVIKRIIDEEHEIACHGVDHWEPKATDVQNSKRIIESVLTELDSTYLKSNPVIGYRQPRMFSVSDEEIEKNGYKYNSSLNPAFIPGHYMHLDVSRTYFYKGNVLQIPASVTPIFRIPLFWLALHNFPEWLYRFFVRRVIKKDGYFTTYFHPWEFYKLKDHPEFKTKWIVRNNSGDELVARVSRFIECMKKDHCDFITYSDFYKQISND